MGNVSPADLPLFYIIKITLTNAKQVDTSDSQERKTEPLMCIKEIPLEDPQCLLEKQYVIEHKCHGPIRTGYLMASIIVRT